MNTFLKDICELSFDSDSVLWWWLSVEVGCIANIYMNLKMKTSRMFNILAVHSTYHSGVNQK
jgi:hypothetical protein